MSVAACGISCDVCGLYLKGICGACASGVDEKAKMKLDAQAKAGKSHCPMLECAVRRGVPYCLKDCEEFPCTKFETGLELRLGPGPFPYSNSFLTTFKTRMSKK